MLTIRGLALSHGEIEALHDVSLDVGEGESLR
jgi:ABC-type branched-subunit amino acid transport system ATPase component